MHMVGSERRPLHVLPQLILAGPAEVLSPNFSVWFPFFPHALATRAQPTDFTRRPTNITALVWSWVFVLETYEC